VTESSAQITGLLFSWSQGDEAAIDKLMPLVYDELHRLARRYMSAERTGHTLQTTALVNEAYMRLVDSNPAGWNCRTHFFAVCAQAMRRILVEWARARRARKRGSGIPVLELQEQFAVSADSRKDLVAIDDALTALAAIDRRKSQVVELRFFGGLNVRETAEALKISEETVHRDWRLAKSWLRREMSNRPAAR
jgi:RNA polymerase sigma-70 factor, ECF subfamily